jgi:PadR family transcriptional regulator PadR
MTTSLDSLQDQVVSSLSTAYRSLVVARSTTLDLLQGTLDLLILKTLSVEPMHGWGITQRLQSTSRDVLQVAQGSLYPALHRLEARGLITSSWAVTENNRQAKYYRLTAAGRRQLEEETATWRRYAEAVRLVLQMA